jgi:hypothetical protein
MVDSIVVGEDSYLLGYEVVLLAPPTTQCTIPESMNLNNTALTA